MVNLFRFCLVFFRFFPFLVLTPSPAVSAQSPGPPSAAAAVHRPPVPKDAWAQGPPPVPVSGTKAQNPSSTSATLRSADLPITLLRTVIAAPGQQLQAIARLYGTSVKRRLVLNPGIQRENLRPGDAVVVSEPLTLCPRLPDLAVELARGIRGRKRIALTFDCGWVEKKDLKHLLDVLHRSDAGASFFLTGIFLSRNGDSLRMILDARHPIYNHSQTHPHFKKLSDQEAQAELLAVEQTVRAKIPGATTRPFWRPPFGERDARILRATAAIGFRAVYWTLDSRDSASSPTLNPKQIFRRVCREPRKDPGADPDPLDGAIVLFHAGAKATPDALEMIIPWLRKRGYQLVDLPTLMER